MRFPPIDNYFDSYGFSDVDLIIYAIHTASVFIIWFCIALVFFPEDAKRLSWALSLLGSFLTSIASAVYIFKKMPAGFFTLTAYEDSVFHGRDDVSAFTCLVFGMVNVMDLLLGLIFYRSRLNILTSLVHRPIFAYLCFYSITGNFFGQTRTVFSQGFMWVFIEEIPTFILALGSVFPSFRMDLTFGVTFFLLRILYHGYATSYAILTKTDTPICAFMCMSLVLHVVWFYQWVNSYRRLKVYELDKSQDQSGLRKKSRTTVTGTPPLHPGKIDIRAA